MHLCIRMQLTLWRIALCVSATGNVVLVFYTVRHGRVANAPPSLFTNHLRSDGPFVPPTELSRHDSLTATGSKKRQCQGWRILYRGMWRVALVPCISLAPLHQTAPNLPWPGYRSPEQWVTIDGKVINIMEVRRSCSSWKREDFSVHLLHCATTGRQLTFCFLSFRSNYYFLGKITVSTKKNA